jgi:arylsulfatase A-like enzyme
VLALAVLPLPQNPRGAASIPRIENILLIVIDTLRADHLGCYGYPRDTSPTIDALAAQSIRFARASAAWPETSQSMAALLSGTYCRTNGVLRKTPHPVSEDLHMLPEILQGIGWQTGAAVTNGVLSPELHYDQGIDDYYYQNKNSETYLARTWIKDRDPQQPFFFWLHYIEPHAPYEPNEPHRSLFLADELYFQQAREVRVRPKEQTWQAVGGFPGISRLGEHRDRAFYIAMYDAEIRDCDAKIAKVLETLNEQGLADCTMVVLTADHGEGLGEHNYYWHGQFPYETGLHVPLIVYVPGVPPTVVEEPVTTIDVAPTILDLLGLPIPEYYEGVSLVPYLHDPAHKMERFLFSESGDAEDYQRAIRDSNFKLIHIPDREEQELLQGLPYELYHLRSDPEEARNVAHLYPLVREALAAELQNWMNSPTHTFSSGEGALSAEVLQMAQALGYAPEEDEPLPKSDEPESNSPESDPVPSPLEGPSEQEEVPSTSEAEGGRGS